MPKRIMYLLQLYRKQLEKELGQHIKEVILYGSYARGDFKNDSDIDILIRVDLTNFQECEDKVFDLTYDFNMENDTEIMPIVQNIEHFNKWKNAYMFYRNVNMEGVAI